MPPTSNSSRSNSNRDLAERLEARYGKPDRYGEYNRRIPCQKCGSTDTHAHVGLNLFRCFDCHDGATRWDTLA